MVIAKIEVIDCGDLRINI